MNEAKVREVINYCYERALFATRHGEDWWDLDEALLEIRDKIETLDEDDLGTA